MFRYSRQLFAEGPLDPAAYSARCLTRAERTAADGGHFCGQHPRNDGLMNFLANCKNVAAEICGRFQQNSINLSNEYPRISVTLSGESATCSAKFEIITNNVAIIIRKFDEHKRHFE